MWSPPSNAASGDDVRDALAVLPSLQFSKVAPEDADTYKCFAANEYGRAVCTVVLNVIKGRIVRFPRL